MFEPPACPAEQQQCSAEWALQLERRPHLAKPAFWAGGPAVQLLLRLLARHRREYDTFIDIGAAIYAKNAVDDMGSGSMAFLDLWSRPTHPVTIHAFEPTQTHLNTLQARAGRQIKLHAELVGDREGSATFYGMRNVATSNTRLLAHPRYAGAKKRFLPSVTIDGLCEREGLRHVHVLKTDTEGCEWEVLLGAHRMIRRGASA